MNNKNELLEETSMFELIKVISKLRDPVIGCPWDLEQTHSSLIPFLLEEAYEVADAIRENEKDNIIEELGDLLLQIMLHSQIASENNHFCFNDVVTNITNKLIRRHPHVFGNEKLINSAEVNKRWEEIKRSESPIKNSKDPIAERLKIKNRSKPAIAGAMAISKKVSQVGFEWERINDIWIKLDEELNELKHELNIKNTEHAQDELGDVLFTLINIARWYKLNPEEGLASTNKKFIERFSYMEKVLGKELGNKSNKELEKIWNQAKKSL